jgi:glucosamine-6-phosphate deaminase
MGVGTIVESRMCVLFAFGERKADIIARTVEGPVTAMIPASVLQLHPAAIILLDEGAAAKLTKSEYFRWVYGHKPDWQRY